MSKETTTANQSIRDGIYYQVKDDVRQPYSTVKDVDSARRTVSMVLNTYNYLDSQGDVLLPGCAKRSIREHGPESNAPYKIKHALFHNLTRLPGKFTMLKEGSFTWEGVKYQGLLADSKILGTSEGNDTLISYNEGVYDNHSIGFRYLDYEFIERDSKEFKKIVSQLVNPKEAEGRDYIIAVKEIELYEGSTVAFGANEMTPALGVKSKDSICLSMEERFERIQKYHNRLVDALKNSEPTEDMLRTFELQVAQAKQYMKNLFNEIPLVSKPVEKKSDKKKSAEIDYAYICKEIKLQ